MDQNHKKDISRRELLQTTGTLVVGFTLLGEDVALSQEQRTIPGIQAVPDGMASYPYSNPDYLNPTQLDSWLSIKADGSITVFTGKVDIGTGIQTALGQIAAEELEVPFEKIRMEMGDTAKTVDQGRTAGSQSISRAGPQIRQACAAARLELLKLGSERLGVPVEKLVVNDGVITVSSEPRRSISYWNLIGGKQFNIRITAEGLQWAMTVAPEVKPKSYKDYKIVGKPIARVDLPAKLTGDFQFTNDVRVPGMLHGRVIRPRNVISGPPTVNPSSISHIGGIVKVVQEGTFVGVVAESEWAAVQAAKTLKVTWPASVQKLPFTREDVDAYLANTKASRELAGAKRGDVEYALTQGTRKYEATYHWPFQIHGMMGPCCSVADVQTDSATVWTGAQGPFTTRDRIASLLKLPKRSVSIVYAEAPGSYGRLTADDTAEDAVVLSRAVGKPVRVMWTREDEHVWAPKGPQQLMTAKAAVNTAGRIIAWDYLDRGLPWTESQGTPQLAERQLGAKSTLLGNPNGVNGSGEHYDIEDQRIVGKVIAWPQDDPSPLRTCALRSPGEPPRVFGSESFMDEIAADLRVDAVEFRQRHINNARIREALEAAANKAGWASRPSPAPQASGPVATGRGVAVAVRLNTIIVAVSEVEVEKATGKVSVKRVTLAHDCGLIVNPDGLRGQLDGNIMHGISRALMEEFKFDHNGARSVDWVSHPVIRFKQVPEVQVVLLNRPELPPSGGAEPSVVVIPASIANAVFDATGARMRQVPFTPERVLGAMKNTSSVRV